MTSFYYNNLQKYSFKRVKKDGELAAWHRKITQPDWCRTTLALKGMKQWTRWHERGCLTTSFTWACHSHSKIIRSLPKKCLRQGHELCAVHATDQNLYNHSTARPFDCATLFTWVCHSDSKMIRNLPKNGYDKTMNFAQGMRQTKLFITTTQTIWLRSSEIH